MEVWKHLLLIADDDHLLHRAIERFAREAGMEVAHAMTGGEVVPMSLRRKPDAILLDLGLPDRDGADVLAQLKATPELAHIPVIVFSGRSEQEHRLLALQLGAENYVEKPFDTSMLIRRIMRSIDKRGEHHHDSEQPSGRFAVHSPMRAIPQGGRDSEATETSRRHEGKAKR